MKFLIFSIFLFLRFPAGIEAQDHGGYNETLASKLIYFAAATFVGPNDGNGNNLTQQCYTQAFPDGTWVDQRYTVSCQTTRNDMCQGLIAVNSKMKVVVVAFRGTVGSSQLIHEMEDVIKDFVNVTDDNDNNIGKAFNYFYEATNFLWGKVSSKINNTEYKDYQFYFTGHSLGGAIAALSAFRAVNKHIIDDNRIQLYTFGEPRVGDHQLATTINTAITRKYRVVHWRDPVPHMPFCKDNNNDTYPCKPADGHGYHHTQEIWYNDSNQKMDIGINDYVNCSTTDGEDGNCSDKISDWNFILDTLDQKGGDLHNHYFNHLLNEWGPNGCSSSTIVKVSFSMLLLSILAKFIL